VQWQYTKKKRGLLPQIRASTLLSSEFVEKNLEIILNAHLLLVEGYFVIEKFDIVKMLVSHFHRIHKKVVFTLSATFMVEAFADKMLEISNQSNLIFCNSEEAESFTKLKTNNIEELSIALHKMLVPLDRVIVITCGSDPTYVSKYDYQQGQLDYILKSFVYPVKSEEIVDTNGCGDAFVGGFLSQYVQGKSLEICARAGNWASSIIIRNIGCTYPDGQELAKF